MATTSMTVNVKVDVEMAVVLLDLTIYEASLLFETHLVRGVE